MKGGETKPISTISSGGCLESSTLWSAHSLDLLGRKASGSFGSYPYSYNRLFLLIHSLTLTAPFPNKYQGVTFYSKIQVITSS